MADSLPLTSGSLWSPEGLTWACIDRAQSKPQGHMKHNGTIYMRAHLRSQSSRVQAEPAGHRSMSAGEPEIPGIQSGYCNRHCVLSWFVTQQ